MADKAKAIKGKEGGKEPSKEEEELLKHPVMANPPFTPVMVTAQRVPIYQEKDPTSKIVGEASRKEIIPIVHAEGPWLMTVCRYEEAWIQNTYVEEVIQDEPDVYFKDQQNVKSAFEEYESQSEEGESPYTETTPYYEQADGYGMLVYPNTNEELFVKAYAELMYYYAPNAEMLGTYKHIMEVYSPDHVVELEDYIMLPAEFDAGGKDGDGPPMPGDADFGLGMPLGTLGSVSADIVGLAKESWGVDLADVKVYEDQGLANEGKTALVADAQVIRVAPGEEKNRDVLMEMAAHIVQFRNVQKSQEGEGAPRSAKDLESEAQRAIKAAFAGEQFEIKGMATVELN